ncbi:MAG: VOC family protein [Haliea sp.]|uniref:VOC family protein n=1 Tax=Haliea sp. TaxID=1932666 RepID=UPI0032EF3FA5
MSRTLDHVIVSVRDLTAAAEAYRRLGFTVMPRTLHENLGSANHIIQLHHNYFELLGDFHNYRDPLMRESMSARFAGGDGLSMLSLSCTDVAADRERLLARDHTPAQILDSARKVTLGDGTPDNTASRSMINWRPAARRWSSMFYTQHDKPETIWFPPWQSHANSVHTLVGISYCSDDLAADELYISEMVCANPVEKGPEKLVWRTSRGECLELLSPGALSGRFPVPVPETPFAVWPVGLRYQVERLEDCRIALREGNVPFMEQNDVITVDAEHAAGVISEFSENQ